MERRIFFVKQIAILFLLGILFYGCEKKLENFDFLKSEPKLVLNAPFISDSTIIFHVSRTVEIMTPENFIYVDNAIAELHSEGTWLETATYLDTGFYSFNYLPQPGENYTISVESPDFPAVRSDVTMPHLPDFSAMENIGHDDEGLRFRVMIDDDVDNKNYYGITLIAPRGHFEYDTQGVITDTIIDGYYADYLRSTDINVTGGIYDYSISTGAWDDIFVGTTLLVDDNLFNGQEVSVEFGASDLFFAVQSALPVYLVQESFDEPYIRYLYSMEMYRNSNDNPIAEKVSIFGNIEGGLGLAYGKTILQIPIILPPL